MKSFFRLVNLFLLGADIYSLVVTARFPVLRMARGGLIRNHATFMGLLLALLIVFAGWQAAEAADVKQVPLWDGETSATPDGLLINRYGGPVVQDETKIISHVTDVVHSGHGAYRAAFDNPVYSYAFFQLALSGFGPTPNYVMSRNILRFDSLCFWIKNDTGVSFTLKLEIKDYRDSNDQRKFRYYDIRAGSNWTKFRVPLGADPGWTVVGNPDLSQARFIGFVFEAKPGLPLKNAVYFDDVVLVEPGPPMYSATALLGDLVKQIVRRQFDGLWGSRSRVHGMIPLNSTFADVGALNCTGAIVKLLPVAVQEKWVTLGEANAYITTLVATLNFLMDHAKYLPPRYVDWRTLEANCALEESPVDAAFLALALYQYGRSLSPLPAALRAQIESLLERFNFAAFGSPKGWKLAYRYDRPGFTDGSYDGYSGEIWTISLAAHLMPKNRVDIGKYYHTGTKRVKACLVSPDKYVVHELPEFRPPFLQWLFPLFVKLDNFPVDSYPDRDLATNPLQNASRYQRDVHLYLKREERALFLQPDAGDDGSGSTDSYQQYSCYNDFGRPDLFMPWSVAFSLLAEPSFAGDALRNHLKNGLHGPLGLSDSAYGAKGASEPYKITARHDFWNMSLSTMAMCQYLFQDNELLTNLPEVRAALGKVFPARMGGIYLLLLLLD